MTDNPIATARAKLAEARATLVKALKVEKTRRRGPMVRQLHEIQQMLSPLYAYSSQAGQDAVIDRIMGQKRGGTFVDIGGYDGTTGSNTFFLEVWRGWTGVMVEPVPAQLNKARQVRRCECLGVVVAATEGEAEFIEIAQGFTQMSGLADSYDPALLDQVRADKRHKENTIRLETRTLSRILQDSGLIHPDFVSLDIEGGEISVLESFPFEDHNVGAWAIENNTGTHEIARIMRAAGYELAEFCGPDEIYAKPDK